MKRLHVLFVCIGNICRSAMAEALARKYGSDVMTVASAGLAPALNSHPTTRHVLAEINVDMGDHLPRRLSEIELDRFDLLVNISGATLPGSLDIPVETWVVRDPYGGPEEDFRRARDEIEMKVMNLILRARKGKVPVAKKTFVTN